MRVPQHALQDAITDARVDARDATHAHRDVRQDVLVHVPDALALVRTHAPDAVLDVLGRAMQRVLLVRMY
jgi:hypothetical protein